MTVGERLISYRKEYEKEYNQKLKQSDPSSPNVKISQDTVSESVGIDRSTLSRIESGKQEIRLEEILKLADYYGVSCDEMIRGSKPEYAKISATTGLSGKSIRCPPRYLLHQRLPHKNYRRLGLSASSCDGFPYHQRFGTDPFA